MAWFDDLNLPGSTVTGHFAFVREDGPDVDDAPDLQLAGGTVRFEPTAKAVRAGGAWVGIAPVTAVVFDGELVVSEEDPRPVRLLSTDADTGVEGWGWEATFNIDGASIKPIRFHAPAEGVHLTGDDLIPITGLPVEVIHGGAVTASSITDATEVGRAVLTAPLTADGRRALNIWDGTRAHLDAGTDTAERTWEAKDLAEFVTDTVAAAGGAASWDDLTGKPTTFPPEAHTHTIDDVTGLSDALDNAGGSVTSADISDASTVGRAILTAPLSVNARNTLSIFTGTRALLDEGTDTAERTWDAAELSSYVTDKVAEGGGASSWDDLTDKPEAFPPVAHTHDDRYYTEAEVDAKIAVQSTGARDLAPVLPEISEGQLLLSRIGNLVQLSIQSIRMPAASGSTALSQFLPVGFRPLSGMLLIVPVTQGNTDLRRFRVTGSGQMLVYNYDANGLLTGSVTFLTTDPWPSTLPGVPA